MLLASIRSIVADGRCLLVPVLGGLPVQKEVTLGHFAVAVGERLAALFESGCEVKQPEAAGVVFFLAGLQLELDCGMLVVEGRV